MLRWSMILVCFFLYIRVSSQVERDGAIMKNSQSSTHERKANAFMNVTNSGDRNGGSLNKKQSENIKSNSMKQRTTNITEPTSDQDLQTNFTTNVTGPRGKMDSLNFGAVLRGFYVFLGLCVIVIMYFTVRAIRLGRKKTKVKKYGILANREDLEMTPLGADDDEEDTTVFDLSSHPG